MDLPIKYRQWTISKQGSIDDLVLQTREMPQLGDDYVLVRIHAASLNYRDLAIIKVCVLLLCFRPYYTMRLRRQLCIINSSILPRCAKVSTRKGWLTMCHLGCGRTQSSNPCRSWFGRSRRSARGRSVRQRLQDR
jgi:hypothetical protein